MTTSWCVLPTVEQCQNFCQNTPGCSHFLYFEVDLRCETKYGSSRENFQSEHALHGPRICPDDLIQGGPYFVSFGVGHCLARGGETNHQVLIGGVSLGRRAVGGTIIFALLISLRPR